MRMNLASTGSLIAVLDRHALQPTVEPGGSGSSTYTATYTTGGSGVAIAPDATITAPDSPTLASMTVTIQNPPNGSSEQLSATTTGTTLTSNYADGVLTVSGVADVATYQTVLQSVQYSNNASTADAGDRTVSIVVNDGTDTSTPATVTVDVVQGANSTPAVTTNPASQTVAAGNAVTFTAAASGNPTPTVQWQVSTSGGTAFSAISGATSTTYTFTAIERGKRQRVRGRLHQYGGKRDQHGGYADHSDRPERDHEPGQPDGQRGRHRDLHRGGQRQSDAYRAVGSEQQRRDVQRDLPERPRPPTASQRRAVKTATSTRPSSATASVRRQRLRPSR